jgi:hypothetical protein
MDFSIKYRTTSYDTCIEQNGMVMITISKMLVIEIGKVEVVLLDKNDNI